MNEDKINQILLIDKEILLSTLPKVGSRNYAEAKKISPEWVTILTVLRHKISSSKRRAKKMNFDHAIELHHLVEVWVRQKGRCPMTGMIMEMESGSSREKNPIICSIDRIDSKRGYLPDNIQLCTHWANNCKNTWNEGIYEEMIKKAYEYITTPRQQSFLF
jgi:hypothetical protein